MTNKQNIADIAATIEFVLEIDKLKQVLRKVRPIAKTRYENTAEHSWQIALFALTLAKTLGLTVDIHRVVSMLLVHDVGEIDAGDKFVFAERGWEERQTEELRAVQRIFGIAPPDTAAFLLGLWKEFDADASPEARFARAIDRSMPVLLNLANQGGSWLENGISYERVMTRIRHEIENGCPELWNYLQGQLETARSNGFFAVPSA